MVFHAEGTAKVYEWNGGVNSSSYVPKKQKPIYEPHLFGPLSSIYLGYKIIGSFSKIKDDDSRPLKFYEAALFQIVNPKAWTISSMAASGFLPKDGNLIISILFISCIALIICPISISPWAAFGSGIKNLVKNNKIKVIIEFFLAFLLLITAILIVID